MVEASALNQHAESVFDALDLIIGRIAARLPAQAELHIIIRGSVREDRSPSPIDRAPVREDRSPTPIDRAIDVELFRDDEDEEVSLLAAAKRLFFADTLANVFDQVCFSSDVRSREYSGAMDAGRSHFAEFALCYQC